MADYSFVGLEKRLAEANGKYVRVIVEVSIELPKPATNTSLNVTDLFNNAVIKKATEIIEAMKVSSSYGNCRTVVEVTFNTNFIKAIIAYIMGKMLNSDKLYFFLKTGGSGELNMLIEITG